MESRQKRFVALHEIGLFFVCCSLRNYSAPMSRCSWQTLHQVFEAMLDVTNQAQGCAEIIQTDNGGEFARYDLITSMFVDGLVLNLFDVMCSVLVHYRFKELEKIFVNTKLVHSLPNSPRVQGKIERFNRTAGNWLTRKLTESPTRYNNVCLLRRRLLLFGGDRTVSLIPPFYF